MSGQLQHPQRGIVRAEIREREEAADGRRQTHVGERGARAAFLRDARHAPDQDQEQRDGRGGLDEGRQRQDGHGRQRAPSDEAGERRDDAETDQHVVVTARHRVEDHHRVQPERHHGERRPRGPNTARGIPDQRHGCQARRHGQPAVGIDDAGRGVGRPGDEARHAGPQRTIDGRRVHPLRSHQRPERVRGELDRCVQVGVRVVDAGDAPVDRIGVDVAREQQRQEEHHQVVQNAQHHHRAYRHVAAPRLDQQQDEPAQADARDEHAHRHEPGAVEPVEAQAFGQPPERAAGLRAGGEHGLERGARGGRERGEQQHAHHGKRDRAGGRSGPCHEVHESWNVPPAECARAAGSGIAL